MSKIREKTRLSWEGEKLCSVFRAPYGVLRCSTRRRGGVEKDCGRLQLFVPSLAACRRLSHFLKLVVGMCLSHKPNWSSPCMLSLWDGGGYCVALDNEMKLESASGSTTYVAFGAQPRKRGLVPTPKRLGNGHSFRIASRDSNRGQAMICREWSLSLRHPRDDA